jgi:PAS domain S-box-containing protein
MGSDRDDQGTGQGFVEEVFVSENVWRVLILASSVAVLLFSIYCLSHGITIIFMHLYYFPIVLLTYRYRYRGFVLATLFSLAYVGLVVFFQPEEAEVIGALCRFAVFIGIAAVVAYLSEQLAAAHLSQKERLETIQNLQQLQESVITNANVWITVLALDGTIIVWNNAAEAICGYKRGNVLGKRTIWRDLYPDKAYRQKVTREIHRIIELDSYLENFETEIRCADGAQKTIIWNTRGIRAVDGSIQSYITIGRDITERKRVEEALRDREQQLNSFMQNLPVGIFRTTPGPSGRRIMANPVLAEMHGFDSIGEFMQTPIADLYADPAVRKIISDRLIQEGTLSNVEIHLKKKNGELFWASLSAIAVRGPKGEVEYFDGVLGDITERKQAEEALLQANKKLNLLSSITRHDINNQLMALQGYLGILGKKQADPSQKEYFQKAATAAQRISSMIQFTKTYESIGVKSSIWQDCRTLVETVTKQVSLGQVTVKNDLPAGTEVFADPLFVKVCYNLMDNAIRYGGKITTIRFSVEERDGNHVIVCEDDGEGVPAEEKEQIFERGFGKNTGMGLFLAREILSITGINIRETGEPGKGARFEMTVPKGRYRFSDQ